MPSLNRLILINTHLKGVVELVVDDHTNICGTNASGKTTLQRLVPVFYGEYPSRVVPATRDSFERWYLPTEHSFLVYEYQRMDGEPCQAILATSSDGRGVDYRLVQKGFDLEDYTRSRQGDSIVCRTMRELGYHFRSLGVPVSNQLNTRQYRAIIQNDRTLLSADSQRTELRQLARQFSLCSGEHSLRHIEKLVRAVHSREGKMETIKSMVAAILEEDGVAPPITHLSAQKVEDWIRDSQLIQGFADLRPEFARLERDFQELHTCEARLSGLLLAFRTDEPLLFAHQETLKHELEQIGFQLKLLEDSWKDRRDELSLALSQVQARIESDETQLNHIEEQYQQYLDSDIDQAKADLEKLDGWKLELDNLRERLRLLTEQHADVQNAYLERKQIIQERQQDALDRLHEQEGTVRDELAARTQQKNDALSQLDTSFANRRQEAENVFRNRKHARELERKDHEQRINQFSYSEEERRSLDIFDRRLEEADEKRDASSQQVETLTQQERQLLRQREDVAQQHQLAARKVAEREQEKDAATRLLHAGQHTLLEFLRREQPGWEQHLGKLIEPSLLQRTDLKPGLSDTPADSFHGLRLDLAALPTPEHAADEAALRIRLQQAEDNLQAARNHQDGLETQLSEQTAALDDLNTRLVQTRTQLQGLKEDRQRLRDERAALKERLDTALAERRLEARKQLSALDDSLARLTAEQQQLLAELGKQRQEARLEASAHWQQVIQDLEQRLALLRGQMDEQRAQGKAELAACESWYQNELKSRGVDETQLIELKSGIRQRELRIRETEALRSEVHRYEEWYAVTWLKRKPHLQDDLVARKAEASDLKQQLDTATQAYKAQRDQLEQQRKQGLQRQGQISEQVDLLKGLLRRLNDCKLPREGQAPEGELDERLRLGQELLHSRESLMTTIKQHVDRFDSLLAGKSGSSLTETWERGREECTVVSERGVPTLDYRRLVPVLAQLLNELVPQSIKGLMDLGQNYGRQLYNFFDVLADIDKRIASQSARITREVSDELFLDGVSNSAVTIRSRITELEFWPELRSFVNAYREWQNSGFTELPGEEYTGSMRRALEVLGRSALTSGISALLEIELRLREGNSDLVIRTDRQLNESSSHGMAYLILCKFLLAFTRLLRGNAPAVIHWPIDELGTLHHNNVKKIFDACTSNRIRILGAFPNPDSEVLSLFKNRYIVNKQTRQLQVVKPRLDVIGERLKARQTEEIA
ncbi:ATP-binding protein [Serpens gallinarum]|uniref:ATP-binding protein n=1 Tax=Serpens gallinarum TaxID=2763075 RepID=A0ABR8TPR6_9PSED|nr:ATP-binding protein [Serpens gallinarum]MBD7977473.1 ATP-binding protein [Serpens gallinarum]